MAIPPHTSHILQPLDLNPFAQFKRNWKYHLFEWNTAHGAIVLVKKLFFEVFWPAWRESMSVAKIQSRFQKTGLFPVNMAAIPKSKYAPAQIKDSKNSCWLQSFIY